MPYLLVEIFLGNKPALALLKKEILQS